LIDVCVTYTVVVELSTEYVSLVNKIVVGTTMDTTTKRIATMKTIAFNIRFRLSSLLKKKTNGFEMFQTV